VESHTSLPTLLLRVWGWYPPDCQIWWIYLKLRPRYYDLDDFQHRGFDLELTLTPLRLKVKFFTAGKDRTGSFWEIATSVTNQRTKFNEPTDPSHNNYWRWWLSTPTNSVGQDGQFRDGPITRRRTCQDMTRRSGWLVWLQFVRWLIPALIADFGVLLNCLMSCRDAVMSLARTSTTLVLGHSATWPWHCTATQSG